MLAKARHTATAANANVIEHSTGKTGTHQLAGALLLGDLILTTYWDLLTPVYYPRLHGNNRVCWDSCDESRTLILAFFDFRQGLTIDT